MTLLLVRVWLTAIVLCCCIGGFGMLIDDERLAKFLLAGLLMLVLTSAAGFIGMVWS